MAKRPVAPEFTGAGFGALLRMYRLRAGYSQEHLAERARVSLETIGALERGLRLAPYSQTVASLVEGLELSQDERYEFGLAAVSARAEARGRVSAAGKSAHRLPVQLTPLIGRQDDVDRLVALVMKSRLVTIVGSSGVGKTRTAIEVATRYGEAAHEEVSHVDLASNADDGSVVALIEKVVGESQSRFPTPTILADGFKSRPTLLLLDNVDQLVAPVATIVLSLLKTVPAIRVLITSTERLCVLGEVLYRLPALSLPDEMPQSVEEARRYSAIDLFLRRAAAEARFAPDVEALETVVDICRGLDGVPRAIELAAARLPAISLQDIQSRLQGAAVVSGGGHDLPARERTFFDAIDRSYDALSELDRCLFRRLSVFPQSYSLEAAAAVCADEILDPSRIAHGLDVLVEKSLVAASHAHASTRYKLLGFARSFGVQKLKEAFEFDRLAQRHARWRMSSLD